VNDRDIKRTRVLERWKVSTDIAVGTLFHNFNMDVPSGASAIKVLNAALKCLDMDTQRKDYTLEDGGAGYLRARFHDEGSIECRKL
jgi:hypothetical protein